MKSLQKNSTFEFYFGFKRRGSNNVECAIPHIELPPEKEIPMISYEEYF